MTHRPSRRRTWALAALAGLAVAPALAFAEGVVAVTSDGRVITFDTATPGTLTGNQVLSGIVGNVVAIDVRPADNVLYAVTSGARLYRIDVATGVGTAVGSSAFLQGIGTFAGMDFAPAADQIRILNELNRDVRVNPRDGTLVDGDPLTPGVQEHPAVAYAAADANFGTDPTLVAVATTPEAVVYGIDSTLDILVKIGAPGQGTLETVGALGVTVTGAAALDVSASTSSAYAVLTLQSDTVSGLYNVNLATGGVTLAGNIGHTAVVVAMTLGSPGAIQPTPNRNLIGLTEGGELIRFRSDAPETITSRVTLTGLVGGETLLAVDVRPSNGRLYGLGSAGRIYVIHAGTGLATPIRSAPIDVALAGSGFDIDFAPAGGRIRIVGVGGENLRADADTGAAVDGDALTLGFQGDTALAFAQGDLHQGTAPSAAAVAFDRNETTANPATFFVIDSNLGVLARVGSVGGAAESPNSGLVHTIGELGVDTSGLLGFEVVGDTTGFAAIATPGGAARLFSIDLTTGSAALIGDIGVAESLRDVAAAPTSNPSVPGTDLTIRRLAIRLNHRRDDRDSVTVSGVIPVPASPLAGRVIVVDVGGVSRTFTLGRRGNAMHDEDTRSRKDDDRFAFAARARDGHLGFTMSIRREDLSDALTDEGLGATEDARGAARTVLVSISVDGTAYAVQVPLRFTARAGRSGTANKTRRGTAVQ